MNNNLIGFDLDGVLISDLDFSISKDINNFLEIRSKYPYPNFVPQGDYVIITGRNSSDREKTLFWIEKFLKKNPPKKIFHDCPDFRKGAEYKVKIINQEKIPVFVESDIEQFYYIKENCKNSKILHFGSVLNEIFKL